MAGVNATIKDVELSANGTLYGQVVSPEGHVLSDAVIQLKYQGTAVAAAKSNADGKFAVSGVRGGAHELSVGNLRTPVRLWNNGTAPQGATQGIVVAADEQIVRGQTIYSDPTCDPCQPACGPSGFGLLDVVTLGTLGAAGTALAFAIDNNQKQKDNEREIARLRAALAAGGVASP